MSTKRGAEAEFTVGMITFYALFFGFVPGSEGNQFLALFVALLLSFVAVTIVS